MDLKTKSPRKPAETRKKLVEAAVGLVLRQGFAATTVDQICDAAGVTKGSFFHHFESKEAIGHAAVACWGEIGTMVYSSSWSDPNVDPLEQLYRHLDIMIGIARRPGDSTSCVVGMLSQEMAATNPSFREACGEQLELWTERVAKMLTDAKRVHPPRVDFDPESLAWMLNSLWQGSMLIAKTVKNPETLVSGIQHGRAYVDSLFGRTFAAPMPTPSAREESPDATETLATKTYQVT
jgi:TetR/AcrR family transcriptional regulator, transcriptional repressor for nem operon